MTKAHQVTRKALLTLGLIVTVLIGTGFAEEGFSTDLFSPDGKGVRVGDPNDNTVVRSRRVEIHLEQLCGVETAVREASVSPGSSEAPVLYLNLFEDVVLNARIHDVQDTFSGGTSFVGFIEGYPGSEVVLVKTGDIVSGNINTGEHFYQVRRVTEGMFEIREIDQTRFPSESPGVSVTLPTQTSTQSSTSQPADTGKWIDILVVYTATARSAVGGTSAMENLIDLAVSETNTGYGNSGVTQRLRLVHTAEVSYSESGFNWSTTLSRLRSTADGYMDDVHTWRDTYGADETVLIVGNTGSCGIGYVMQSVSSSFAPYAFAVVSKNCATGYYSFAHELGHNMGCAHDRANASVLGAYDYSYGYQAPDEAFRTIMAYNCAGGCTRVNYWSNPDEQYGGQDMGVDSSDPQSADNRKTLNNTLSTVRNFRQQVTAATLTVTSPNGGETLTENTTHTITWSSTGTVGNVKIQYSTNNGSSWSTVVSSTANDGSYNWTVPGVDASSCLVKIFEASDSDPTDTSNAVFTIMTASPGAPTLTVTSPNGGETLAAGSTHAITWSATGTVGNVKIQYSKNNGGSWSTVVSSTANDGSHNWTVPSVDASKCLVKIFEASDGSPADTSNAVFSIVAANTPTLTVTSPNGGETLEAGTTHAITWSATGSVGNVKIEYSANNGGSWSTIASATANDGKHNWTVPQVDASKCLVRVSEASDGSPSDTSNTSFSIFIPVPPEIALNRTSFNFGAIVGGSTTGAQSLRIDNDGGGVLSWTVTPDGVSTWLAGASDTGTGNGAAAIMVDAAGLAPGDYSGAVTVSDPDASNSPLTVTVNLKVKNASDDQPPFGEFATPQDGSGGSGSIAVTGWVLDDVDVESVKIYNGPDYVGDAIFVEGARTDVEAAFPDYPKNFQAGWGYMLLTHFLPNGGNGSYTLYARAVDSAGKEVTLGSKTISLDNNSNVKPFGALDAPGQGAEISGGSYRIGGWALTPQPNKIPESGYTIDVYIDNRKLSEHPAYNVYRSDIAGLFPGYANSDGAHGYLDFDTTEYENGIHTISWIVTDNAGNAEGIGSRFFMIQNSGVSGGKAGKTSARSTAVALSETALDEIFSGPVRVAATGRLPAPSREVHPTAGGGFRVEINELERLVIHLTPNTQHSTPHLTGALRVGDEMRPLPVGANLDVENGVFYWTPLPGFVGSYELVFTDHLGRALRKITVVIGKG